MPHSIDTLSGISDALDSTNTSADADVFPKPGGATLQVQPDRIGPTSPAKSDFSFEKQEPSYLAPQAAWSNDIRPNTSAGHSASQPMAANGNAGSRRRTQYYEESFAYKDNTEGTARERISKDSPVVAELRTNVIIKDEYTLVTDLSHHLSTRYQRPESSIMIALTHSACLLLGGSFEPAYILTISALPSQVQAATNKRNTALVQSFMADAIGVTAERGIIKYTPIAEENLAINGRTVLGEIEKLERRQVEENGGTLNRILTKSSRKSFASKPKSTLHLNESDASARLAASPPPPSPMTFDFGLKEKESAAKNGVGKPALVDITNQTPPDPRNAKPLPTPSKRSRSKTTGPTPVPPPPPIPKDEPTPKLNKRKSFVEIFRRK